MPVNTTHPTYGQMTGVWRKMRDTFAGQTAIKEAGTIYLPPLTSHIPDDKTTAAVAAARYNNYKSRAIFFGATENTIMAFKGMVLRKEVGLTAPDTAKSKALTDNLDLRGTSLSTFVGIAVQEMLVTSRLGLLVDFPTAAQRAEGQPEPSVADAERANIRPFVAMYKAEDIFNWRVESINNVATLSMVVLREFQNQIGGDFFVEQSTPVMRVLRLDQTTNGARVYLNETYVPEKVADGWKYPAAPTTSTVVLVNGQPINYLPFYFINATGTPDPEPSKPVLEALADMNLGHYRNMADYENALHQIGVPTVVLTGFTPVSMENADAQQPIYLGADSAIISSNDNAKADYLEFKGQGLTHIKAELEAKETRMAALGAAALLPPKSGVEAAETLNIRRQGETSVLAGIATAVEEAITNVLITMFGWDGQNTAKVFVKLNKEFVAKSMDAATLMALLKLNQAGKLPDEHFVEILKSGDVLPYDATVQDLEDMTGAGDLGTVKRTKAGKNATGGENSTDAANGGGAQGTGVA